MKQILFIVNPISGVGKQKEIEKSIDLYLDKNQFISEVAYTSHAKHAMELGRDAIGKYDIVIAIGGDGSVNELADGLINTDLVIGVIPTGSGNGLARFLQIPLNVKEAIQVINRLKIIKIDTLTINERNFLNVAGVGFDAWISHKFATGGKRGFWGYFKSIVKEFLSYEAKEYELTIDGKKYVKRAFSITLANSSQFGFNAHISPLSKIDDGLIEVCLIRTFPWYIAPVLAFRLFAKNIDKSKYSEVIQGKEIEIRQSENIVTHIDGEPVAMGNHLKVKINPKSLNIIIP